MFGRNTSVPFIVSQTLILVPSTCSSKAAPARGGQLYCKLKLRVGAGSSSREFKPFVAIGRCWNSEHRYRTSLADPASFNDTDQSFSPTRLNPFTPLHWVSYMSHAQWGHFVHLSYSATRHETLTSITFPNTEVVRTRTHASQMSDVNLSYMHCTAHPY